MQWLREGHIVKIGKDEFGYGDEIPASKVDKDRLEKWKEKGWVGSVPKPGAVSGKDKYEARISDLEASNKVLVKEKQALAEDKKALIDKLKALSEEITTLEDPADKKAAEDKIKELEGQVAKLTEENKKLQAAKK